MTAAELQACAKVYAEAFRAAYSKAGSGYRRDIACAEADYAATRFLHWVRGQDSKRTEVQS